MKVEFFRKLFLMAEVEYMLSNELSNESSYATRENTAFGVHSVK